MSAHFAQEDVDMRLVCRCAGKGVVGSCIARASQEDGLCDWCRCEHGACQDHTDEVDLFTCLLYRARRVDSIVRRQGGRHE